MTARRRYQIVISIILFVTVLFAGLYLFILQPALLSAKSSQDPQNSLALNANTASALSTVSPATTVTAGSTATNTASPGSTTTPTGGTNPGANGGTGGGGTNPGGTNPPPSGTTPPPQSTPTPTPTSLVPKTDNNWSVWPTSSSSQNCWWSTGTNVDPQYYTYHCRYVITRGAASPASNRSNWSTTEWSPVMVDPPSFGNLQPGESVTIDTYAYASSCPLTNNYFYVNIGASPDDYPLAEFTVYFSCPKYA